MSFKRFLNEGLIKVPTKLLHVAETFFKKNALAYLAYRGLKQAGRDKDEQQFVLVTLKRVASSEGIPMPTAPEIAKAGKYQALSIKIPMGEIAQRYVDQLEKKKEFSELTRHGIETAIGRFKIKFTVAFDKYKDITNQAGNYRDGPGYPEPEVVISIPNLKLGVKGDALFSDFNAALIARRIRDGVEAIEHELTHGVQFHVLKKLHADQVKGPNVSGGKRDDRYLQDPTEFDPQIKTNVRHFRSRVEAAKLTADSRKTRALFDEWVKSNDFLNSIKKLSMSKWRKAIKLIWTDYDKRYL